MRIGCHVGVTTSDCIACPARKPEAFAASDHAPHSITHRSAQHSRSTINKKYTVEKCVPVQMMTAAKMGPRRQERAKSTTTEPVASNTARRPAPVKQQ